MLLELVSVSTGRDAFKKKKIQSGWQLALKANRRFFSVPLRSGAFDYFGGGKSKFA